MQSDVCGIVTGDWQLHHKPPIARSSEPNWYEAMLRPLREIKELASQHQCPIFCDGDLLDSWKQPVDFINWLVGAVPVVHAIPGNHDLPFHNYNDLGKSAYWTLVETGNVIHMEPEIDIELPEWNLMVTGFPWGHKLRAPEKGFTLIKGWHRLALVHAMIWKKEQHKHKGAMDKDHISNFKHALKGYHFAAFGDNHKGFLARSGDCAVINTGTLMRRRMDEISYQPKVGLLHRDGTITRHALDCSQDVFIDAEDVVELASEAVDASELVEALLATADTHLDFLDSLRHVVKKLPKTETRHILTEIMERCRG